ncbi:MAG: septal ring lytic transglycosylase RlpA family protein [Pseudomonadota bacterium]
MKKIIPLYMSVALLFLFSCAREKYYVKMPPAPKATVLHVPKTGKPLEHYEVFGERYYPLSDAEGFVQVGKASWYGEPFHGRTTSSGRIYDMHQKTAAHKILPFDTVVKVINLSNQKYTIVPITDRGPFVKGRDIDLSYAAAKEIELIGPGVADVKIIALGKELARDYSGGRSDLLVELKEFNTGVFTVQVGAFQNRDNAFRLGDRLKVLYDYVDVLTSLDGEGKTWYRVHVSKSNTLAQAMEIEKRLENIGFADAFILRI